MKSYAGRPWIWCELHDFGGNQGFYGAISNVTKNSVAALAESDTLVGYGLTPEGYEDTKKYFHEWTSLRYGAAEAIPEELFGAWELLRDNAYDVKDGFVSAVGLSIYQLWLSLSGLTNRTGHYPAPPALQYDPSIMKEVWQLFYTATLKTPQLLSMPSFHLDFVDVTRQLMGNAYIGFYNDLVHTLNTSEDATLLQERGNDMLSFLKGIDAVLNTDENFTLEKCLNDAKAWGETTGALDAMAFNARNQVTIWGIQSGLDDYAAKAWSGLVKSYYGTRWQIFVDALVDAKKQKVDLDEAAVQKKIRDFAVSWQYRGYRQEACKAVGDFQSVIKKLVGRWPATFH